MPNKRTKTVLLVLNAGTGTHGSKKMESKSSDRPSRKTSGKGTSTNGK